MKKLQKKSYRYSIFNNIKLKYKLFFLISFIVVIVCSSALILLQYTYKIYDEQIYKEAAKSLHMSSTLIEAELRKIERMTYNIIANESNQSDLLRLQFEDSEYDSFRIRDQLKNRLTTSAYSEPYVWSIQFVDNEGRTFILGVDASKRIDADKRNRMAKISAAYEGGYFWTPPDESDNALILTRDIRSASATNLSLLPMGTIMVRIDIERLISRTLRSLGIYDDTLIIYDGTDLIFERSDVDIPFQEIQLLSSVQNNGYDILLLDKKSYFKTHVKSIGTQWTYVNLIPFDRIFSSIELMKKIVIYLFAGLILLVLIIGIKLAQGVTKPIEGLNDKMKIVGLGNFNISDIDAEQTYPKNEIGQLHRNFRIMIEKINELITENFSKQLTIKETEYKALQAQINPHFLYNTLESINWLAKMSDQTQISKMVESLGFLLRSSISRKEHLITIEEEIKIVESYITIQKIRFDERLSFKTEIPDHCKGALIPKLSLQPFLENSISYALDQMIDTCYLSVHAYMEDDRIFIAVEDNGPGMDEDFLVKLRAGEVETKGTGIGLNNIDERIKLLFGEEYGLQIESERHKGTKITIMIPYLVEEPHV